MNKLQLVKYILNHSDELLSWYCYNDGTRNLNNKNGFNMPEPENLTYEDVTVHGTGFWGDVVDLLIEDALDYGIIDEEMLES